MALCQEALQLRLQQWVVEGTGEHSGMTRRLLRAQL